MNDEEEVVQIRKYANKNNLKVISVGFYHNWCDKSVNVDQLSCWSG